MQILPRMRKMWPSETGDILSVNMLLSGMQENSGALGQSGETMPATGRCEKRIARAMTVEIRPEGTGMPEETTLTENVSPRGARVLMNRGWLPGQHVLVTFPKEGVQTQAQVVYCQHLPNKRRYAVGLQLFVRLEL